MSEPYPYIVRCLDCGADKTITGPGIHHPWCACGSDRFDWGNEREVETQPAMTAPQAASERPLPPVPPIDPKNSLSYSQIRGVTGYPAEFVRQYATDYARAALADRAAQPVRRPLTHEQMAEHISEASPGVRKAIARYWAKRAELDARHAAAELVAASAAQPVRMLTAAECHAVRDEAFPNEPAPLVGFAQAVIRKFCEVNGLVPLAPQGESQ